MIVLRTNLKRVENAIPTDIGLFSGSAIHSATNKIHTFCVRLLTANKQFDIICIKFPPLLSKLDLQGW